jgi:hypothetical protein
MNEHLAPFLKSGLNEFDAFGKPGLDFGGGEVQNWHYFVGKKGGELGWVALRHSQNVCNSKLLE